MPHFTLLSPLPILNSLGVGLQTSTPGVEIQGPTPSEFDVEEGVTKEVNEDQGRGWC